MIPNGTMEQCLLQVRVDELERRLARLEEQVTRRIPETSEAAGNGVVAETGQDPGEEAPEIEAFSRAEIDAAGDASGIDDANEGLEGVRLVAIELLSAGYGRQEVANYLRSTFGVADSEAVLSPAEPAPG